MIVILTIVVIVLVAVPTEVETVTAIPLAATETHGQLFTATWAGGRTAALALPVRMAAAVTTLGDQACRSRLA